MVINDGAGELAHGTTFSESTTFNAVEGPATLWLYTNGDDPGPLPVAGEEIVFNGAVVGGPINANLGLRAYIFVPAHAPEAKVAQLQDQLRALRAERHNLLMGGTPSAQ